MDSFRELMDLLRRVDPVPERVRGFAVEARDMASRWDGSTGLSLVSDTALAPPPGVRSGSATRHLEFAGAGLGLVVQLVADGVERLTLVGLVVPPSIEVEVRYPTGSSRVLADGQGGFRMTGVPAGPLSFALHPEGAQAVATEWLVG
ncbi:hypothetical protein GCM10012275_44820 [Longimycelium tulufanense]|uniref:Uncharacterized protein n=2 Tax=Longimycelium tulufanense TaxID=907463 RepID=A0A8J3FW65_9PSEU|nr:hypothetical protein GCM10012275_44820 [Longimycelium tulufanense]